MYKVDRNILKQFNGDDDPEREKNWFQKYLNKHSDRTDLESQTT
jgi:hypothetical protein